eukprot:193047_1
MSIDCTVMLLHGIITFYLMLSVLGNDFKMDNLKVAFDDINGIDFLNSNYSTFKVVIAPSAVKYGANPVMMATESWEKTLDNGYPNIVYDANNTPKWQLWYTAFIYYNDWKGINNSATLYAKSDDGITWNKPILNIVSINGSTQNNAVCKSCHGWGVWKDKQDNNTYKVMGGSWLPSYPNNCSSSNNCTVIGISDDGIHWNNFKHPNLGTCWATHNNMFFDPKTNNYKGYTRTVSSFFPRSIARWEASSKNTFIDTDYWVMLNDNQGINLDDQFYDQEVMPFHSIYLGFISVYQAEDPNEEVDCQLTWSLNTKEWFRLGFEGVGKGQNLIKRNVSSKDFDSHLCYCSIYPIDIPGTNTTRFYYFGANNTHFPGTTRQSALGFVTIRRDGFAGITNRENGQETVLISYSFTVEGKYFIVTLDVYKVYNGTVRVGLVGIKNFGIQDCLYIFQNVTNYRVQWKSGNDISALNGKQIKAQFELNDAVLYTYGTVS